MEKNPQNTQINLIEHVKDQHDPRFAKSKQVPDSANFVENRYVLRSKDPGTDAERFKALWILQGYHDRYRYNMANDYLMLMRMMMRVIVSFAATFFNGTL